MICCFFGHKDVPSGLTQFLIPTLTELITEGVDSFLVGNQGGFDSTVLHTLRLLKEKHPHITYNVVLAYMPGAKEEWSAYEPMETFYPEGLESVHPRFAISWRNKWMVQESMWLWPILPIPGVAQLSLLSWRKGRKNESSTSHR